MHVIMIMIMMVIVSVFFFAITAITYNKIIFSNVLQLMSMITVPRSPTHTKLTRTMMEWVMFVITAHLALILSKRILTMMQKGMRVIEIKIMMVIVSIELSAIYSGIP